eukprot:g6406.t1
MQKAQPFRLNISCSHLLLTICCSQQTLASTISSWWAQLAALEAEWLLEKHVEAHSRVQRLQTDWDRFCPDQPVLMLRLEGTAARLYAQQGDWASAAMHTERCCALAERAFGRTHGATIALRARLGDAWSRREDWDKAVAAYQEAYSVAQVCSDEKTTGRLAFELAQVLFFKGDLTGAKGFAEDAVKLLIPLELGRSSGQLSGTSFEALTLLSKVYEDLCQRFLELHETEQAEVSPAMLQALVSKAIKCFETVLKNLPASEQAPRRAGVMSRAAQIVQSVLRLKVMGLGDSEYSVLVDAVEELLLHASVSETASALQRAMSQESGTSGSSFFGVRRTREEMDELTRGVRQLQPRAETRAVAEAALRPVELEHAEEVPVKLMELFEEPIFQVLCFAAAAKTCHCLFLAYKFFFRPGKDLRQYGEWAVITGATDGIGKAYAFELARQGLNEIKAKHPVTVEHLKVDFSDFNAAQRNAVKEKLSGTPGMLSRRRGAIVNTSSGSARATAPLLAEYAAAKAYVERFSMSLGAELASKGIDVQAQTPLYVTTKMAKIRKSSITVPSPQSYVACAARHIGYEAVISPWWAHSLQLWGLSLLPEAVSALINGIPPSNWFDHMVRVVAEGFAGAPVPGDATYLATIQMLELCRFFGNAARVIMCATSSSQ